MKLIDNDSATAIFQMQVHNNIVPFELGVKKF